MTYEQYLSKRSALIDDLQKLIDGGAEKTHGQHIVAAGFADAPEHDDAHRQENKFSAAVGDLFHHRGDRRGADAF